jgi:hypothetical protein
LVHRALQCPEPMSPKHVRAEPQTDGSLAQARPATVLPVGGTPASVGGGVPRVQTPLVQRSSEAQARPQTPQLRASVRVLAQPLLQSTCGAVQLGGAVQVPLTQVWPPVHARLQPPQWVALVRGSTQAPSQRVRGASQLGPVVTHWALWQTVPSVQAMPQPPQLALSLRTSTQARLHTTRGAGQSGGGSVVARVGGVDGAAAVGGDAAGVGAGVARVFFHHRGAPAAAGRTARRKHHTAHNPHAPLKHRPLRLHPPAGVVTARTLSRGGHRVKACGVVFPTVIATPGCRRRRRRRCAARCRRARSP